MRKSRKLTSVIFSCINCVAIVHKLDFFEAMREKHVACIARWKNCFVTEFPCFPCVVANVVFHGSLIQKSQICRPLSSPRLSLVPKIGK